MPDAARARLRELAGHHVPLAEIAAVLRMEFKLKVDGEILEEFFNDDVLIGRALAAVKVSEKTIKCALEGSASAQKALFDRTREAGAREEARNGGRQIQQIRLVVVDGMASRLRSEPLIGNRDTTRMRAAAKARWDAERERKAAEAQTSGSVETPSGAVDPEAEAPEAGEAYPEEFGWPAPGLGGS